MSGTSALTDRYVAEVVRRIPADQRGDVADELHATIADTVEARGQADSEAAEREVLTEMGDPIRLAAQYADRPLALIGPGFYPTYIRLLTVLLSTVLPVVTAVSAVLDVLDGQGPQK
ncbi:HAAS signaling domain-containing protein [Streptomyces sp. NPDC056948]|uniref:HAAS signaling domain-containing protein n=1 Tax=Streptomyces sp. NPDC056948 TaxID=3345975 RepID=UPI003625007A